MTDKKKTSGNQTFWSRHEIEKPPRLALNQDGDLFTITGRLNCGLSLAGHKKN